MTLSDYLDHIREVHEEFQEAYRLDGDRPQVDAGGVFEHGEHLIGDVLYLMQTLEEEIYRRAGEGEIDLDEQIDNALDEEEEYVFEFSRPLGGSMEA